jgi:soluble lytic murein transglycosylase
VRARRLLFAAALITALIAIRGHALADEAPAVTADGPAVRQEFLAALQRARARVPDAPDSPALVAYPIYDYLVAARLRRDLELAPGPDLDAAIDRFLQDRPQEPVGRALRHEWLISLARRGRWDWFLPRTTDITEPVLICARFQARLATGDTAQLGADALAVWLQPMRPPRECEGVFSWLHARRLITPAASQSRVRAALEADNTRLAREWMGDVPAADQAALSQWARLLEAPKPALEELAQHPEVPVETEALLVSFARLARTDNASALSLLPTLLARPGLTSAVRLRLQRAAALGAAYDHSPAALPAFRALPPEALDNDVHEWRIRAALWAGDFDTALAWIKQLPESLSSQARWRYWQGRVVEAQLGSAEAAPMYREAAGLRDYYGYLAADRLHSDYHFNGHPSPDDGEAQKALGLAAGMVRAHELFECDLWDDAAAEWAAVLADAERATKVQAAHLAAHWGWYTQAIVTLVQAGEWDDLALRYPRPYADQVAKASTNADLPSEWIYAVMRQESLFRKDATSRADARGLMQLLPGTAATVARGTHLPVPSAASLYDPNVNIPLGAAYLKDLFERYQNELAVTLAAYNAGPWAVARWMPHGTLDADIWVENIPYNETRNYVQHVFEHIMAYARERQDSMPRLSSSMGPIRPALASVAVGGDPPTSR